MDKFIMMDVLASEKAISVNTATAMTEASCQDIFNAYEKIFNSVMKEVKEVFNICYNNNWYQLEESQSSKITKESSKLCAELNKEENS